MREMRGIGVSEHRWLETSAGGDRTKEGRRADRPYGPSPLAAYAHSGYEPGPKNGCIPVFGAKGSGVECAATVGANVFRLFWGAQGRHKACPYGTFAGEGEGGVCILIQLGGGRKGDTVG